ncbi:hypothetical protein [Tahibacter soli]|uniref:Uncharacterized protein n=1 Tax=Tahibacter soli TaxID=2983605 RepID=A0A9X4BK74_9GAMM|nr:hypothetical protein [Tahibacter soli]MDC8015851.1 hypothetical protein [Tahibacter soli]
MSTAANLKNRVVLELSDSRILALEEAQRKLDLSTRKELFNYAVGLLEWAIKQRELGRVIMVGEHDSKTYIEMSMPALDRIIPVSKNPPDSAA